MFVHALLLSGLALPFPLCAQLDAPPALRDYSSCSHQTCTWMPLLKDDVFRKGEYTYRVNDEGFVLRHNRRVVLRTGLRGLSASVSVVWSEDSRNFAITWSTGGAIGFFRVRAFHVDGDVVTELPGGKLAWREFTAHHGCKTRGDNIQAHSWLPESQRLVLVLSVYPTGDCGWDMGYTEGYVVDAPTGEIREHWNLKQLNAYLKYHPE